MARLRWEDVRAPQMDTRDFALAGQGITSAFDRLGQALVSRQNNRDEEAYSAILAPLMLEENGDALRQGIRAGMAQLNPRLQARLAGKYQGMLEAQGRNAVLADDLGYLELRNANANRVPGAISGAYGNDMTLRDALLADLTGKGSGRFSMELAPMFSGAQREGVQDRQTATRDDQAHSRGVESNRIQSRSVALREREYAQREADRKALEDAQARGLRDSQRDVAESAESVRILATREARDQGLRGPAFDRYVNSRVDGYLANQLTPDEQAAIGGIGELQSGTSMFSSELDTLQAAGQNVFEQEHRDLAVLQRARELGKKTYDEGFDAYKRAAAAGGVYLPEAHYRQEYDALIGDGVTPAMVIASRELYGNKDASFWTGSKGLRDNLRQITDLHSRGGTVLAAEVLARINQPVENARQQLERALRNAELAAQASPDRKVPAAEAAIVADLQKKHREVMERQEEVLERIREERDKDSPRTKLDRDRQAAILEEERRAAASSRAAGR